MNFSDNPRILSICNIYLFSRFGFKSGICLLIAPVPVHCFSITFVQLTHRQSPQSIDQSCLRKLQRLVDNFAWSCSGCFAVNSLVLVEDKSLLVVGGSVPFPSPVFWY